MSVHQKYLKIFSEMLAEFNKQEQKDILKFLSPLMNETPSDKSQPPFKELINYFIKFYALGDDEKIINKVANARNRLRREDHPYQTKLSLAKAVLTGETKYSANKKYLDANKHMKTTLPNLISNFNYFLKSHRKDLIVDLNIDEDTFQRSFFPDSKKSI